jgi:hypothetical protein
MGREMTDSLGYHEIRTAASGIPWRPDMSVLLAMKGDILGSDLRLEERSFM